MSWQVRPTRWCVLISGRGSNLASMLETPGVDLRLVATSDAKAAGVSKAIRAGVPVLVIPRKDSGGLDWSLLDQALKACSIDAIFLLGFMRIVPASFVCLWRGKILNLHPSLLPKYSGLKSIERAVEASDDVGCTIHEVVTEVDAGPVLGFRRSVVAGQFGCELAKSETFVHIDEQRMVKETAFVWRP
jgi:phosphoribosylglycinamide formyltransferase-1